MIKNIDPGLYGYQDVAVGDEVAAAGLIPDEHGSGYRLGKTAVLAVGEP